MKESEGKCPVYQPGESATACACVYVRDRPLAKIFLRTKRKTANGKASVVIRTTMRVVVDPLTPHNFPTAMARVGGGYWEG